MRTYRRISLKEREKISYLLGSGLSLRDIAKNLGREASSIAREVKGNMVPEGYSALQAELQSGERRSRNYSKIEARIPMESKQNLQGESPIAKIRNGKAL